MSVEMLQGLTPAELASQLSINLGNKQLRRVKNALQGKPLGPLYVDKKKEKHKRGGKTGRDRGGDPDASDAESATSDGEEWAGVEDFAPPAIARVALDSDDEEARGVNGANAHNGVLYSDVDCKEGEEEEEEEEDDRSTDDRAGEGVDYSRYGADDGDGMGWPEDTDGMEDVDLEGRDRHGASASKPSRKRPRSHGGGDARSGYSGSGSGSGGGSGGGADSRPLGRRRGACAAPLPTDQLPRNLQRAAYAESQHRIAQRVRREAEGGEGSPAVGGFTPGSAGHAPRHRYARAKHLAAGAGGVGGVGGVGGAPLFSPGA